MKTILLDRVNGLFVSFCAMAVLFAMPTFAQDEDEDAAELGRIEVTGSRLNQTDIETASPVTAVSYTHLTLPTILLV